MPSLFPQDLPGCAPIDDLRVHALARALRQGLVAVDPLRVELIDRSVMAACTNRSRPQRRPSVCGPSAQHLPRQMSCLSPQELTSCDEGPYESLACQDHVRAYWTIKALLGHAQ